MADEILYTPEELALKLKLSKYTIYEMIKRGDIHAHHIGRSIRVSESQLQSYLMNTGKVENVFDSVIVKEGASTYAVHKGVRICVNTDLEDRVKVSVRPEDIILSVGTFVSSARNVFQGTVVDLMYDDKKAKLVLDIGLPLVVLITRQSLIDMDIKIGDRLFAVFKTMAVKVTK